MYFKIDVSFGENSEKNIEDEIAFFCSKMEAADTEMEEKIFKIFF